jgi:DNA-binding beta-propeller fold protein YncE
VDKWKFNEINSITVMNVTKGCFGLFIDINNTLYCSMRDGHQVIKGSLSSTVNMSSIAAGNGSRGSDLNMLDTPRGIFVNINLDLYVADCDNHRIQLFKSGNLSGITVLSNTTSQPYTLNYPTGIVLDSDGYLFVVDSHNHRVIRSDPNGVRCLVGCLCKRGTESSELNTPRSLAFDSYGNIFVIDMNNHRIQKFFLATNSCSKYYTMLFQRADLTTTIIVRF